MKTMVILLVMVGSLRCFAADNNLVVADSTTMMARSYVFQNEKIKMLLDAHYLLMQNQQGITGFRVQIFMDSGSQARLRTQRARADFERKYPDNKAYITYDEPNFKLRVGDFRTRLEARRFMEQISEDYPPESVYIVIDTINFPDLD